MTGVNKHQPDQVTISNVRLTLQSVVKKWFRDKDYGFIENGQGPDVYVHKTSLANCQFLRQGVTVEFDCFPDKTGLKAKNVRVVRQEKAPPRPRHIGVMV